MAAARLSHKVRGRPGTSVEPLAEAKTLEHCVRPQGRRGSAASFNAELARPCRRSTVSPAWKGKPVRASHRLPNWTARVASCALLASSKGKAVDYLRDHRAAIRPLFSDGEYAAFEKAVNAYEFESALEALHRAAGLQAVSLEGESA
jgi:hypothetical protein